MTTETVPPARRRRWLRWTLIAVGLLVVVLCVLVALIPTILSTGWARGAVEAQIDSRIQGSVQIGSMSLSWGGPQVIRDVVLKDPEGKTVATVAEVSTQLSLWGAVRGNYSMGHTLAKGADADLVFDKSGRSNLDRAIQSTAPAAPRVPHPAANQPATPAKIPSTLSMNFELADAKATITAPGQPVVTIAPVAATVNFPGPGKDVNFTLSATTREGSNPQPGSVTGKGEIQHLFAPDGTVTLGKVAANVDVNAAGLPTSVIDQLGHTGGLAAAALGPDLALNVKLTGNADRQQIHATLTSALVTAPVDATVAGGVLALDKPSVIRAKVTPALTQKLAPGKQQLAHPVPVMLTVPKLSVPTGGFDPAKTAIEASLVAGAPVELIGDPQVGPITISNLAADVSAPSLAGTIDAKANADLVSGGQPGKVALTAKLAQLFNAAGKPQIDKVQADAVAHVQNLPAALVDRLARQNGLVVEAVGNTLDLDATAKSDTDQNLKLTLSINSPQIVAKDVSVTVAQKITLDKPVMVQALLTPALAQRLLHEKIEKPARVFVMLTQFEAPRPATGQPAFEPEKTLIKANLTSDTLALRDLPRIGAVDLDKIGLQLTGNPLTRPMLALSALASNPAQPLAPGTPPYQIGLDAAAVLDPSMRPQSAQLNLKTDDVTADVAVTVAAGPEGRVVSLAKPGTADLRLTPEALAYLKLVAPGQPTLAGPTSVHVELDRLSAPMTGFTLAQVAAAAKVTTSQLALKQERTTPLLNDANAVVTFDGANGGAATLTLRGQAAALWQATKPLMMDVSATNVLNKRGEFDIAAAKIEAKSEQLPTAFVEAVAGAPAGKYQKIVGPVVNVDASAKLAGLNPPSGTVSAKLTSQNVTADLPLKLANGFVQEAAPLHVQYTLTPAAYDELMAAAATPGITPGAAPTKPRVGPEQPATLDATVSSLKWRIAGAPGGAGSAKPRAAFDPSQVGLVADVKLGRAVMVDRTTGERFVIDGTNASVNAPTLAGAIAVKAMTNVTGGGTGAGDAKPQAAGGAAAGAVLVEGAVSDLFTPTGAINDAVAADLSAKVTSLPTVLVDAMTKQNGELVRRVGPTVDASVTAKLQKASGPVTVSLDSANVHAKVAGQVKQWVLTLTAPATLTAAVDERYPISLPVLGPIMTNIKTAKPIAVTISPQGASVPLKGFDIAKVHVEQMTVELGQAQVDNAVLNQLLGVLGSSGGGGGGGATAVWFTPAVLRLDGGRLDYTKRLDLLVAGRVHLALWGDMDLKTGAYQQVLGVAGDTLVSMGAKGVSADQMIAVPVRGGTKNPQIDFGALSVQLAPVLAGNLGGKRGGQIGALLGEVQGALGKKLNVVQAPPPSVTPLPWGPLPGQPAASPGGTPNTPSGGATPQTQTQKPQQPGVQDLIDLFGRKKKKR